jgi:hypothetical protein
MIRARRQEIRQKKSILRQMARVAIQRYYTVKEDNKVKNN